MLTSVLFLHVLGAVLLCATALLTVYRAHRGQLTSMGKMIRLLSIGLFFEIASGAFLAMLSATTSLTLFCRNIGLYTLSVFAVLFFVYYKQRQASDVASFPSRFVLMSMLGAIASTIPVFVSALS
jgi:hypothetical protein